MGLDDLDAVLDAVLARLGSMAELGEEFRVPPLDVHRYFRRAVKLHWLPVFGRALSVVAVVRQPPDLGRSEADHRALLDRLGRAVHGRFPPLRHGHGLSLGLTALVLTPEPIFPEDDSLLAAVLTRPPRGRAVPLGLFRLNLGQEAMAFALAAGPGGLFREPQVLADALSEQFGRFVPTLPL